MNLQEQLAARIQGKVAIMGIGNPCRGDDGAGSFAARKISQAADVLVIDAQDVPEDHLCLVMNQQPDTVLLIDAVDMDSPPGSVALLEKDQVAGYWPSTHRMPLSLLMDCLARETCASVFMIAIQPRRTAFLQPMSEEVSSAVAGVSDLLNNVLAMLRMPAQAMSSDTLNREIPA
jgi:hydrogenase 3 maturation protease